MHETRHSFREELRTVETETLSAMDLVTSQLGRALESVAYQDVELAGMVIAGDHGVDRRYLEMHSSLLSLLACQAPVACDLRLVAAVLHTIHCIARIGDQCVNIAKLVPLSGYEARKDKEILDAIERMGKLAYAELTQVKDAFETRHLSLARDLARQDAEINRLGRELFALVVVASDDPELREWAMFMILVARALERIGHSSVDIAEQVVFIVTGALRERAFATV